MQGKIQHSHQRTKSICMKVLKMIMPMSSGTPGWIQCDLIIHLSMNIPYINETHTLAWVGGQREESACCLITHCSLSWCRIGVWSLCASGHRWWPRGWSSPRPHIAARGWCCSRSTEAHRLQGMQTSSRNVVSVKLEIMRHWNRCFQKSE